MVQVVFVPVRGTTSCSSSFSSSSPSSRCVCFFKTILLLLLLLLLLLHPLSLRDFTPISGPRLYTPCNLRSLPAQYRNMAIWKLTLLESLEGRPLNLGHDKNRIPAGGGAETFGERFRGNRSGGNRPERFWEIMGSLRGPLRGSLRGPLVLERISVLLPLIVLPLETPTKLRMSEKGGWV